MEDSERTMKRRKKNQGYKLNYTREKHTKTESARKKRGKQSREMKEERSSINSKGLVN